MSLWTNTHLENEHSGAFSDYEATAVGIKWPRCFLRGVVEVGGQASGSSEAANGQWVDARLGTAGNHYVGIAACNETSCITDGMGTGCARSCGSVVWSLAE